MHKRFIVLALILTLVIGVGLASAADKVINLKITDVTQSVTKNGKDYVRIIVAETRLLQGVSYPSTIPVMVFDETLVPKAMELKVGDTLKAIVKERSYQGRESYTLMAFMP